MAKINFTADRVSDFQCEPGKNQSFIWDTTAPGLGLRVTASEAKRYIYQVKLKGKTIRITIGTPKAWAIDAARIEARRLRVIIDSGQDPRQIKAEKLSEAQEKRDAKELAKAEKFRLDGISAARLSLVARTAWDEYLLANHPTWSQVYREDHEKVARPAGLKLKIGKELSKAAPLSFLLSRPLSEITSAVVAKWMSAECAARPTFAHNSLRKFKPFIAWCAEHPEYQHVVNADCCLSRAVKAVTPSNKTKEDDCLQKEQLNTWFAEVRKINNSVIRAYLQALLLTGARRNELASLEWKDIDFQWNRLTIRDKVEGMRTIPLTPYVSHLLGNLPRRNGFVFSSPAADSGHLTDPHLAHNKALKAAGLPHVTLHGLRRSFNTLSEWTETPSGVVAQIIGHKPSAISEKHYKRRPIDMLRMWHVKIEEWILEQAGIDFMPVQAGLRAVQ